MADKIRRRNGRREVCYDTGARMPLWFPAPDLVVGECKPGDVVETPGGLRFEIVKASMDDVMVRAPGNARRESFVTAAGEPVKFSAPKRPIYIAPMTAVRKLAGAS